MNRSLSVFTPRCRPLGYSSLEPDTRVRSVVETSLNGSRVRNLFAIERLRVASTELLPVFQQPETVAYCHGPLQSDAGDGPPFPARWAAWVAAAGVRVKRTSAITLPSNTGGTASQLYPDTRPARLSIGFSMAGLMAMAIQRSPTLTEIKRYTSLSGATATVSFAGYSPALFNTAILHFGGEQPYPEELICFYLRRDLPYHVFARFEGENFGTEHIVAANLLVKPTRLISAEPVSGMLKLYGIDEDGRYLTLTSVAYSGDLGPNRGGLGLAFTGGAVYQSAVVEELDPEAAGCSVAFTSGRAGRGVAKPSPGPSPGKATLGVAFSSGEVI